MVPGSGSAGRSHPLTLRVRLEHCSSVSSPGPCSDIDAGGVAGYIFDGAAKLDLSTARHGPWIRVGGTMSIFDKV